MTLYLVTGLFGISCFAIISHALPIAGVHDAESYLRRFGYIPESAGEGTLPISDLQTVTSAIQEFQRFAGLNQTGVLDDETIRMMNTPRCGVKDILTQAEYELEGSKWHKKRLTYRINNYPTRNRNNMVRFKNEIIRAFKVWSDVTKLSFEEKPEGPVDIDIKFAAGYHGDWNPFDGAGGTLAHAYFPQFGGDAHFDNDETWTIHSLYGTNLFQVAVHEFGHSLGLKHSEVKRAIMTQYYNPYEPIHQLHADDIRAIQALYGPPDIPQPPDDDLEPPLDVPLPPDDDLEPPLDVPLPPDDEDIEPPPDRGDAPNLCQDATIDTITRTQSGSTYVFKGHFYWKVFSTGGIANGYPRRIYDDWSGLVGNLDASFTWSNGRTYFFKGRRYWRFKNRKMDSGYPKYISEGFPGIPDNLDAAFVWGKNNMTFFFKGDKYWRYDTGSNPPVRSTYPQQAAVWSSMLARGIDAALGQNGHTYFFKGDQYYKYNDEKERMDSNAPYPLSTAEKWFNCA